MEGVVERRAGDRELLDPDRQVVDGAGEGQCVAGVGDWDAFVARNPIVQTLERPAGTDIPAGTGWHIFPAADGHEDDESGMRLSVDGWRERVVGDFSAEMAAGTWVDRKKRVLHGAADSFAVGKKVFVFSKIKGQKGNTVKHVWKRDDKKLWEKEFTATSNGYRTWSRMYVKAGTYTVEAQTDDGEVLGSVTFTVTGDFSK